MIVNDNFANPSSLTDLAPTGGGSNSGATAEVGEPTQSGPTNSAWWSWTAPNDGTFTIDTKGSDFDTYLSVFTGSAVNNLTLKAFDDDGGGTPTNPLTSLVILNTTAGTTYQIAVDGFYSYTGNIQLKIVPVVINGTSNSDTLITTAYPETINGLAGNDNINGGGGDDTISGGDGSNVLDGGTGADRLIGGPSGDRHIVDNVGDVVVELPNQGVDRVESSITYTLPPEVEYFLLTGTAGVSATGNNLNNLIRGNSGANILNGLAGDDNLWGHDGNDTIYGGDGIDNLYGDLGADQLIGGLGDDRYDVDNVGDTVSELPGEGNDVVVPSVTYTLPEGQSIEQLYLSGTASINGTGNDLPNIITGNAGNNMLNGGGSPDTLNGGGGLDILSGGTGVNTFVFGFGESSISTTDHITDFEIGMNKIDLLTGGTPMSAPNSFSRAANSAAVNLSDVINQAFADANGGVAGSQALGINSAALIVATNSSIAGNYLVINDATAGFSPTNDLVIKLTTGGAFPPVGAISVTNFFV